MKGFILPISDPNVIDEFRGKYFFLSNFYIKPVYYNSEWYRSSEHAFQAQKATNEKDKQYVLNAQYPGHAKTRGNEIICRPNWKNIRMMEMYNILRCKFTEIDGILASKLLETENALLIEGNNWGDRYWGKVRDSKTGEWVGENFHGQLLMKVRNEII
jgi:ribA/ribD-fused uncharacterized protein